MKHKYNNLWKTSYMLLKWPLLRKGDLFPLRTSLCFWDVITLGEDCVLSWHCLHNHRMTNLTLVKPPDNRCNPEECWNRGSSLHGNILCQAVGKSSEGSSRGLLNSVCIKYLIFLETLPPKVSSQYPSLALATSYINLWLGLTYLWKWNQSAKICLIHLLIASIIHSFIQIILAASECWVPFWFLYKNNDFKARVTESPF